MRISFHFLIFIAALMLDGLAFSSEDVASEVLKDPYLANPSAYAGQFGYWKTVTEGTVPQKFQLKVIGTGPYPGGIMPGWSFTLFEALDSDQIDLGGVHGMSGSPVFIKVQKEDGSEEEELIGAYAYGFGWVKGKTPLWATPIEAMKDLFRYGKELPRSNPSRLAFSESIRAFLTNTESQNTSHQPLNSTGFPLVTTGFSEKILDYLQSQCMSRGLNLRVSSLSGGPIKSSPEESFTAEELDQMMQPGGAVAAVLMQGDFFMGGIGTITYRDGNKVLAMGHPIFNLGTTRIPIMAAKILTIVSRYDSSMKFGYPIGPVLGTFYQDRLAGVAGEIGWITDMIPMRITVESPHETKVYQSSMIQHQDLIPLLASAALGGALDASSNQVEEQSYTLEATFTLRGHEPLKVSYYAMGSDAFRLILIRFKNVLELISNNPFELPYFENIEAYIEVQPGLECFKLLDASCYTKDPKPGKILDLGFTVNSHQDQKQVISTSFVLPKNHPNFSQLRIHVAAAHDAADITEPQNLESKFRSLDDILFYLKNRRSQNAFYVQLLEPINYCRFNHDERLSSSRLDQYRQHNRDADCVLKFPKWRVLQEKTFSYPALCTGDSFLLKF